MHCGLDVPVPVHRPGAKGLRVRHHLRQVDHQSPGAAQILDALQSLDGSRGLLGRRDPPVHLGTYVSGASAGVRLGASPGVHLDRLGHRDLPVRQVPHLVLADGGAQRWDDVRRSRRLALPCRSGVGRFAASRRGVPAQLEALEVRGLPQQGLGAPLVLALPALPLEQLLAPGETAELLELVGRDAGQPAARLQELHSTEAVPQRDPARAGLQWPVRG